MNNDNWNHFYLGIAGYIVFLVLFINLLQAL